MGQRAACASCGAEVRPSDRFCSSCGAPIAAAQVRAAAAPPGPSASLQIAGHEQAGLAEQRKVVTVVFADLTGSTPLAERLDPEELRSILTAYFNVLARQIQRYEGTIDKYIGDAVMAVFGAPISHEDDAERAISATLAMQGAIAKLNDDLDARHGVRLALRVGINTGEVVAGLLAGEVQSAYTVVGDAVNTAQRFEAAARPGTVLVSHTTRQLAIHSFEFEPVPPLALKGKARPVAAYRVVRRRYEEIEPEATPFLGRTPELERLRAAMVGAVLGTGTVHHVSGEAGVGKSRLVGELRAGLVAGVDRLVARCASFESNSPYALVADLLRGAFRIHATDDEDSARRAIVAALATFGQEPEETHVGLLLDVLGYAERTTFDPEKKRVILVHLLRVLLRDQSARAPFVITAEDLQWVDGASIAVLADLISDVRGMACVFVTTSRPEWTPPWAAERIELAALSGAESRAFVDAVFGVPAEDALAEAVLSRTGGNPFFIEEVVRGLKESDLLVERTGRVGLRADASAGVPATVQEVLEARLERLPQGAKRALAPAAVCGRTFWYRVLDRLVRLPSLPEDLAVLERELLIVVRSIIPELTYAFRQALVQEVAYQTQLLSERRAAHGRVAEAIEALYAGRLDEFVHLLAYHYARADRAERAVEWLVRAGDRARRLYANEEAIRSYTEALGLATSEAARIPALEGLGDVHATLGRLEASRDHYARALASGSDDPGFRARLERKTAFTYMRAGDFQGAREWHRRALGTIGERPSTEVAAIWLDMGQMAWRQGRLDDSIVACRRGIEAARSVEDERAVAEGLRQLGTALVLKGEREAGAAHYRQALAVYESLKDPFGIMAVRNNLGVSYRRQDRWEEALREQEAALAIARRIGDAWSVGTILSNNGEALRFQGRYEEALAAYEEALRIWTEVGDVAGVALQRMNIGVLHAERGDADAARRELGESLAEWRKVDSKRFLPELYRTLARVELGADPATAKQWAIKSLEVAREIRARDEEAIALQVLGRSHAALGESAEAASALRESVALLRETRDRLELGRSLLALADVLRGAGEDPEEVRRLARDAAGLFAELGNASERAAAEALAV